MSDLEGADQNFLERFHKLTGFNCADKGEAHSIRLLSRYPLGYAPPFVYITGADFMRANSADNKVLREYLHGGGMLFGDAGGPGWGSAFRHWIQRQVLPGSEWLVIADDDPIFQMPYQFPHGAPPFWHHDGTKALGIKYKGRWCVFYHPGDVNDAWKIGRSGISRARAEMAYEVGINVAYYAFTHYLQVTQRFRR
jgi:hypothetical protein